MNLIDNVPQNKLDFPRKFIFSDVKDSNRRFSVSQEGIYDVATKKILAADDEKVLQRYLI
jgi:hypothetical protein